MAMPEAHPARLLLGALSGAVFALLAFCGSASAETIIAAPVVRVVIAAAASTIAPLGDAARVYAARQILPSRRRIEIVPVFASSGALARQVIAGGPAEIFISANRRWMDSVAAAGRIDTATRRTLAANALVLAAPAASLLQVALTPGADLAGALNGGRLVTADPAHAPLGQYAEAALRRLGAWSPIEARLVRVADAAQARVLVERGAAAAGVLYASDVVGNGKLRLVATFPRGTYPPPIYEIALVGAPVIAGDRTAAREVMNWLLGPDGQAIFARHGFLRAGEAGN